MRYLASPALAVLLATLGLYVPTTTAEGLYGYHSPSSRYGALPSSGSAYDRQSGNSYYWSRAPDGSMNIQGYNTRTEARWNRTIKPNGDQSGWDSRGNYWQYDSETGYYHNYGTGRTCFGRGALHRCN